MENINTSIESKLVNEVMELVQKSDNKTNESQKSKKDAKNTTKVIQRKAI